MSYIPTKEDYELISQPICKEYVKIEIYDNSDRLVDILNGVVTGGQSTINCESKVRRTYSCPIVPTDKQSINIAENSLLWIDKKIKIYIGLKTERMKEPRWYSQGKYVLTDASISYNATDNTLQINCSDLMIQLDGTVNGEFNGALNISIPAYEIVFSTSWTSSGESFDTAYNSHHNASSVFMKADVKNAVLSYYNAFLANNSVDEVNYILAIQSAINNYNYIYKVKKGNSDGGLIILAYNTIKSVVKGLLTQYTDIKDYILEDIGEYKGTKHYDYYLQYQNEHPTWDCVPYDQEFSAGTTIASAIETFANLYSGYDFAFDEDGKFVLKMIPTLYEDDVVLTYEQIKPLLVAEETESATTDLKVIRNVCEVWGKCFESAYYSETCSTSGNVYDVTINSYGSYKTGEIISIKFNSTSVNNMCLNINGLGAINIYDEYSDKLIAPGTIVANKTYSFKYKRCYIDKAVTEKFYLLGQYQVHGLAVLSNGETIKNGYTTIVDGRQVTVDKYSKDYFKYKYNCNNIKIEIIKDSPYVVQKIGERNKTYADDKYAEIQSDSTAVETAAYELWKNCRITDSITIKTSIIPWLNEYMKISYKKANTNEIKQYITHNISHDHENHISTIEMYTFYPLYQSNDESELVDFELSASNYTMTGIESLSGNLVIPEKFLYKGVEYKITSIAESAFANNTELISVTMPDTITKVGASAFSQCKNLESVILSNNVTRIEKKTFYDCYNLKHISFSINLKYIGDYAFNQCSLTDFKFNRALQEIGDHAFFSCSRLTKIEIPGSVKKIGAYAFNNINITELTLNEGLQYIGNSAFSSCKAEIIKIPSSVETIESLAFYSSSILLVLYKGNANIGKNAFNSSTQVVSEPNITLTSNILAWTNIPTQGKVNIPSTFTYKNIEFTITKIGLTFNRNLDITYVSIPDTVKKIQDYAFYECENLTSVYMTDSVEEIGSYAFQYCYRLKDVRLSNSLKEISPYCFGAAASIRNINLPTNLVKISNHAFYNSSISCPKFPKTLTYIGEYAFSGCHSLDYIYIPSNVKTIDNYAFSDGFILYAMIEEGVETINSCAFYNSLDTEYAISLPTAVIPISATSIGNNAFYKTSILACKNNLSTLYGAKEFASIDENDNIIINLNAKRLKRAIGYNNYNNGGEITIPYVFNSYFNYAINRIDSNTFIDRNNITSLIFEEGIISVASLGLSCTSVKSISIPASMTSINENAFIGCINLEEINVNPSNASYCSVDGVFMTKNQTVLIKYPANKVNETYSIPDTVTIICNDTFTNAKFTTLNIPNSVSNLKGGFLINCPKLTTLIISEDNPYYYVENNVLFSKDKTQLIYNANKVEEGTYTIPDTVIEICDYAFYKSGYTTINIPNTVITIGESSFADMSNLDSIEIPDSVTSIGSNAFNNVSHIYYNGSATGSPWGANEIN